MAGKPAWKRTAPDDRLRVWIELERPAGKTPEAREADAANIATHANRMLQRMNPGTGYRFFWSERKSMWCFGDVSYTYLADSGTWIWLDHAGREFTPEEIAAGMKVPNH